MKSSNLLRLAAVPAMALLAVTTFAPDAVSANEPLAAGGSLLAAQPLEILAGSDAARVYLDRPGDGALWARGRRWKASFDESGATYFAGFGARQPRSLPHALSPDRVTIGGELLDFARAVPAGVFGERIEIDRGAFVEAYELGVDSIEQLFVFESLPRAGELVVHIPIASELDGVETDSGLEFRGENGRVTYSRAVAIDARGRRSAAPTRLVDGEIRITVDAGFLAGAALPLVIDPVVQQFWLDVFTDDRFDPDMAWDPFHQAWLAVYAETFSATDIDVFAKLTSAAGVEISSAYVDATTTSWTRPRVANNGAAHRFLVVAERTSSTPKAVVGRMVIPNGTILTIDPLLDIGGPTAGDKTTPDVGGDPSTSGSTNFCVGFMHTITGSEREVGYTRVSGTGVLQGAGPTYFPHTALEVSTGPSISRSNGGGSWMLAWTELASSLSGTRIRAASVDGTGSVTNAPFALTGSMNTLDEAPSVSSPLTNSARYAIAFTRRGNMQGSIRDIFVSVVDGGTNLQTVNLTALENSGQQSANQYEPSVDSDGQHFLVSYTERVGTVNNPECYASDLYVAGNQIGLAQSHVQLHPGLGLYQAVSQVAAMPGQGGGHRYGVVYQVGSTSPSRHISAVLFDGFEGGTTSSFCAGDGSIGNCPCGNNGINGRGCGNSVILNGALLTATGTASTVNDTLLLQASDMPLSSTCLFFQGSAQHAASAFGDGLLCIGGTNIRLGTKSVPVGSAQFPAPGSGDPSVSVRGGVPIDGGVRYYQVWYRNAAVFCTSATFNLTSGVSVNWAR